MIRWLIALGACVFGIIVAGAAVFYWRGHVAASRTTMAFEMTQAAIKNEEYPRALLIINSRPATDEPEDLRKWADFEVKCSVKLGLLNRLESVHRFHPQAVLANEDACMLLARTAMHLGQPDLADQFADAWRNKSPRPHLWTCFDADRLIFNGKPEIARRQLESVEYDGPADCGRLVRLAMLTGGTNYLQAWNHLATAYVKNPRNAEVRLYRGQILESAGKERFARVEFEAAHFANTNNPIYLDSLAEFYRRQGNNAGALDVWAQSLNEETAGFIWTKALFWNRVTRGAKLPDYTLTNRSTVYFHFNRYLSRLSSNEFWNEDKFDLLPHQAFITTRQQEAWWLQILELLRQGKERTALDRLVDNPFGNRIWSPELYTALTRVLSYRAHTDLNPGKWFPPDILNVTTNSHSFLFQLEDVAKKKRVMRGLYEIPKDLKSLLESNDGPAAALLAGGWFKAGLELFKTQTWPNDRPAWVPYAVTQATRLVDGEPKALTYAQAQLPSPALNLLIGEMLLATGDEAAARRTLTTLMKDGSAAGQRSAWMLARLQFQNSEWNAVKETLAAQPKLAQSIIGREIRAGVALAQSDTNTAIRIYQNIVSNSFEAKAFLAGHAYTNKDYATARRLTEEMQFDQPDNLRVRARLETIRRMDSQPAGQAP